MPRPQGFVWYELMTTDADAAEAFYTAVIGWRAQRMVGQRPGMPDGWYTIMSVADKGVAGMMALPADAALSGVRPRWVGYIYTPDVDAATVRLRNGGGIVHREPADIVDVGRFSVVADPQGATFMLFTPRGEDNLPAALWTPGHIGWHELYADDWTSAFDFYAGQFAWTKAEAVDMGAMGTYQLFAAGGPPTGGMMDKPPAVSAPAWQYYFNITDASAAADRVVAKGGQILMGPEQVPGGSWILNCMDPQGALFALVQPPAMPCAGP